jgi:SAM-dependent methyltransferase
MITLPGDARDLCTTVREFFIRSGYTEQAVCHRLGLGAQHEILSRKAPLTQAPPEDAAGILIRLFLEGGYVEEGLLPAEVAGALEKLGLLAADSERQECRYAPVFLYPLGRQFIASDRWNHPDGSRFTPPEDIVYPAITKNTYRFLSMLPAGPCERFLELCSGTGAAAFAAASRYAARAWAVDITERSTRFAEFNRLLNGLDNVTVLQGDLYAPVADVIFDRIVAHPPYVPALSRKWIFQDAGAEGEDITRSIVAGLPRHLSPGGRLYCLALGADVAGEPFERRLRGWLGEDEGQFDCLLAVVETHTPEEIASQPLMRGEIAHAEFVARREAFSSAGIERFVYGLMVLERHAAPGRPPFTVRRQLGPRTGSAEFEWAMRWEAFAASPDSAARLLEARPKISRTLELQVIHRHSEGDLAPASFTLQAGHPFNMECRIEPWTASLLPACDGVRTCRELHQLCLERAWIPPHVQPEEFARFLATLVSGGFIEIEGFTKRRRARASWTPPG